MDNAKRFLDAIKEANIQRVVIVDDALAAPELREEDAGPLRDILTDVALAGRLDDRGIDEAMRKSAVASIVKNELDEEAVSQVWTLLYKAFVENERSPDPGGRFSAVKGDNARALRPFIRLLSKCDPAIDITWIGGESDVVDFKVLKPQLVFLDYILDERVSASNPSADAVLRKAGVEASRKMLNRIVDELPTEGPSVVLMSSDADVVDEADDYRHKAKGFLFSSRFQFVPKNGVTISSGKVAIDSDAAGTLLDLTQCQAFGVELNDALVQWRTGTDKAIKDLFKEIQDLELKDFAYLVRFRLTEEGQPLSEYLEWFFGELLLDRVGGTVNWSHKSFDALNAHIDGPGRHIEGMFDGATSNIAEMFSRVRVDRREVNIRDRRMGDLYMPDGSEDEIRAVLTPDCDLMERKSGPRAARMLTVVGKLMPIDAPNVNAADFIELGGQKHSIDWDTKDLQTLSFGDARAHPEGMKHVGTLRPLYAYELQRRVLDDIGRVGLATAPAVHFTATCAAHTRVSGKLAELKLDVSDAAQCSVVPHRGGSSKHRVVFHRGFVEKLIDGLQAFEVPKVEKGASDDEKILAKWLAETRKITWENEVMRKLCATGIEDGDSFKGIAVFIRDEPKKKDDTAWCQLIVRAMPKDVGGEALSEEADTAETVSA